LLVHRFLTIQARGQGLVEFALVFPLFIFMVLGLIEFAFVFNAVLALDNASRNAALLAAEAGSSPGADCVILEQVLDDVGAPADSARVSRVTIFWSDQNGQPKAGGGTVFQTVYDRGGTTTCTFPDNTSLTVPFRLVQDNYPVASRCNFLGGCGGNHPTLDIVGVKVTYQYVWKTPVNLSWLTQLAYGGPTLTIERSDAMRMEPVL
jgi:Flp pilus assembly protein TadG